MKILVWAKTYQIELLSIAAIVAMLSAIVWSSLGRRTDAKEKGFTLRCTFAFLSGNSMQTESFYIKPSDWNAYVQEGQPVVVDSRGSQRALNTMSGLKCK